MRNLDWGWWGREKERARGTPGASLPDTEEAGKKGTQNEKKVKRPEAKQRSRNR